METKSKVEKADELRLKYDLATLLKEGVRGKYAKRYEQGTNPILFGMDIDCGCRIRNRIYSLAIAVTEGN